MDAFIFDMDGVIVDSELHWKSLEGFFLQSLVPGWSSADQGRIIGLSQHDLYTLLCTEYGLQMEKELFSSQYTEMAHQIYGEKVALIKGFSELLALLNLNNVPVALASSSLRSWIEIVLERFDLKSAFKVVVSAEELQGEGKPSPAIYLHTARLLNARPQRCVVLEDSRNGVLSAKNAGMFCIGFRNGFNEEQDLSAADLIVHSLEELNWQSVGNLV